MFTSLPAESSPSLISFFHWVVQIYIFEPTSQIRAASCTLAKNDSAEWTITISIDVSPFQREKLSERSRSGKTQKQALSRLGVFKVLSLLAWQWMVLAQSARKAKHGWGKETGNGMQQDQHLTSLHCLKKIRVSWLAFLLCGTSSFVACSPTRQGLPVSHEINTDWPLDSIASTPWLNRWLLR